MLTAIVLAAGKSSRMGRTKALLPIGEHETFLSRIVNTFRSAGVTDVVVVIGHDARAIIERHTELRDVRFVVNERYEEGQFSSLLTGLNAVAHDADGALVTLVDLPLVSAATIEAVVDRHRTTGAPIIRPASGTRHGHPIFVARSLFAEIRSGDPRTGAKPIVRRHASVDGDVPVDDEGAFFDVDTPSDYDRVTDEQRRDTQPGK